MECVCFVGNFHAPKYWGNKRYLNHPNGVECINIFRMSRTSFINLAHCLRIYGQLKDKHVKVEEVLGMFLFITAHAHKQRIASHFFQHSLDTVHHHVRRVARALCRMAKLIIQPSHMMGVHPYVQGNPKYYHWFKVHACSN